MGAHYGRRIERVLLRQINRELGHEPADRFGIQKLPDLTPRGLTDTCGIDADCVEGDCRFGG